MTEGLDSAEVRDLAPELATGGLGGTERAVVLAHLTSCPACQAYVERLASVADGLLLLAPTDEPPAGFESRVLARMHEARPPARPAGVRGARILAMAAALVVVALAAGGGAVIAHRTDRHTLALNADYVHALQGLGGTSLRAAPLLDANQQRVGQAFIYDGKHSWVFVSLDHASADGTFTVVCTGPRAGPVSWPGLQVSGGKGALGWAVAGDVRGLQRVDVVDGSGHVPFHAVIDPSLS